MKKSLLNCALFKDMTAAEVESALAMCPHTVGSYSKGDIIALKDSRYISLIIISAGSVSAETTDRSQNRLKLERINAPALIAPSHLFAENNRLPVNLSARNVVSTIHIERDDFADMMGNHRQIMVNFLEIISSSNRFISENVVYLTYKTIKGKFANYILDNIADGCNDSFHNTLTQREMAEMFGVTRPALARAIGELAEEGTIYVRGKEIKVLFTEKLRQYAKQ